MSIRWGLLSTAAINLKIIEAAAASEQVEVGAVASRDLGRAKDYAKTHGIPRWHGDYAALLADPEVDAVYISLPNGMHVDWAMRALEAGKHVLVEKPFSRRPDQVEAAFDLAERRGLVLSEAFMWRHHPQTALAQRLIADGAIGRLRAVRAAFSFQLAALRGLDDTRFDPALDGGSLMDVGCYCLNGLRCFAGEPVRISAERVDGPSGVDVSVAATLRFADGVVGQFDCSFELPYRAELQCVGDDGSLILGDPWQTRAPGIEIRIEHGQERREVERIAIPVVDSYRFELEDVAEAIVTGRAPLLGRADAVGQARAISAVYRAAEAGAAVRP